MGIYKKMQEIFGRKSNPKDIKIIHLETIDSTNNYLRNNLADQPNFTIAQADFQTAGRGQGTNTWESAPAQNLLFSILIHPPRIPLNRQFLLSEYGALAIKEGIKKLVSEDITLKWPNDIYWRDRKLSGTLIETSLAGNCIKNCIFGVGLNVNQTTFPTSLPNPVSLKQITHNDTHIPTLLQTIAQAFKELYPLLEPANHPELSARYHEALYRASGLHTFHSKDGTFQAAIIEVEDDGHIILRHHDGTIRSYTFKEIEYGQI